MDKRFVIPGLLYQECEQAAFVTASDAAFTINTKRILNTSDLIVNEFLNSQNLTDSALTTTPTPISWQNAFVPASVDGISFLNATTVRITKKGHYQFKIQTNTDVGGKLLFKVAGPSPYTDGNSGVAVAVGSDLNIAFLALFDFHQTTDAVGDFVFSISGDTFPTAGSAIRQLSQLTVWHVKQ